MSSIIRVSYNEYFHLKHPLLLILTSVTKMNGRLPCQDRSSVMISVFYRNLHYKHLSWWSGCVWHNQNKCAVRIIRIMFEVVIMYDSTSHEENIHNLLTLHNSTVWKAFISALCHTLNVLLHYIWIKTCLYTFQSSSLRSMKHSQAHTGRLWNLYFHIIPWEMCLSWRSTLRYHYYCCKFNKNFVAYPFTDGH